MQRVGPWMAGTILVGCIACTGCGGSSDSTGSTLGGVRQTAAAKTSPTPTPDTRDPKAVLTDFFKHVRQRRFADAHALLSPKAREVVEKLQIALDPFRRDGSVRTEVVGVEPKQNNRAHVLTRWSMSDGAAAMSIDIRWVMRDDTEGWRIVGTIGTDPRGQPIELDFENERQMRLTQQPRQPDHPPSSQTGDKPTAQTAQRPSPGSGTP